MALDAKSLNIITAVRYEADIVNTFNRMTFLFDPNWQGIGNTLPICFYYVKDFKEVMESEVSQKALLFYNSQNGANPDAVAGGLLGIVSDNIINKPKKYQMTILLPRNIDTYLKQSLFNRDFTVLSSLFQGRDDSFVLKGVDIVARMAVDTLSVLLSLMGLPENMLRTYTQSISEYFSDYTWGVSDDSNKVSLEAMWENRTILKMKEWNGWRFKYVAIENFTPSKDGTEDGFYEAILNLTEVPIMTVRKQRSLGTPIQSTLAQVVASERGKKIVNFIDSLENKVFKN